MGESLCLETVRRIKEQGHRIGKKRLKELAVLFAKLSEGKYDEFEDFEVPPSIELVVQGSEGNYSSGNRLIYNTTGLHITSLGESGTWPSSRGGGKKSVISIVVTINDRRLIRLALDSEDRIPRDVAEKVRWGPWYDDDVLIQHALLDKIIRQAGNEE